MKTPYDAALRLRKRELDLMRVAISSEVSQLSELDQRRDGIDASVRSERAIASGNAHFPSDAFAARMRAQREIVCTNREASHSRLEAMRTEAIEAFGQIGAIAAAAGRHREEAGRIATVAEQRQLDDFSAARFARTANAARRDRIARVNLP